MSWDNTTIPASFPGTSLQGYLDLEIPAEEGYDGGEPFSARGVNTDSVGGTQGAANTRGLRRGAEKDT